MSNNFYDRRIVSKWRKREYKGTDDREALLRRKKSLEEELKTIDDELSKMDLKESIPDEIKLDDNVTYFTVFGNDGPGLSIGCSIKAHADPYSDAHYHLVFSHENLPAAKQLSTKFKVLADIMHCKVCLEPDALDCDGNYTVCFDTIANKFASVLLHSLKRSAGPNLCVLFKNECNAKKCANWMNDKWAY